MPETPTYTRPDGRPVRVVQVSATDPAAPPATDAAADAASTWAAALGLARLHGRVRGLYPQAPAPSLSAGPAASPFAS